MRASEGRAGLGGRGGASSSCDEGKGCDQPGLYSFRVSPGLTGLAGGRGERRGFAGGAAPAAESDSSGELGLDGDAGDIEPTGGTPLD